MNAFPPGVKVRSSLSVNDGSGVPRSKSGTLRVGSIGSEFDDIDFSDPKKQLEMKQPQVGETHFTSPALICMLSLQIRHFFDRFSAHPTFFVQLIVLFSLFFWRCPHRPYFLTVCPIMFEIQ